MIYFYLKPFFYLKILITIFSLMLVSPISLAWDNENQFEPNEMASEDIINMIAVCIQKPNIKKLFPGSPKKRLKFCGCIGDVMRVSESINDYQAKSSKVIKHCAEITKWPSIKNPNDRFFLNSEQLYIKSMACVEQMKKTKPETSFMYRNIACGCKLDAILAKRSEKIADLDASLCRSYAEKESK